jgi:putative two-component system response regulator
MTNNQPIVLVVDDEPMNLRLFSAMLVPLGFHVLLSPNGKQGIAQAKENDPDVILLDVMMPEMDGYEVLRCLKEDERTAYLPVVMVTALRDVDDRVRALELGADDFLTKPVDKTELQARVKSLVKVKAYYNTLRDYHEQLRREVEQKTEEVRFAFEKVKNTTLDTIYRLSQAAVFKDEGTGSHIQRISRLAAVVARKMGLDALTIESILYAAPMHDVGKIGIPDYIVLKPYRLTPDEWAIMKEHTTIGAKILEGSEAGFVKIAELIALTHHEQWDGGGYPLGLKGEQIPLVGRITAIVDVFDALVSSRPYKEPFTLDEALGIIRNGNGTHFDPRVVTAFFEVWEEIIAIRNQFRDEAKQLSLPRYGDV